MMNAQRKIGFRIQSFIGKPTSLLRRGERCFPRIFGSGFAHFLLRDDTLPRQTVEDVLNKRELEGNYGAADKIRILLEPRDSCVDKISLESNESELHDPCESFPSTIAHIRAANGIEMMPVLVQDKIVNAIISSEDVFVASSHFPLKCRNHGVFALNFIDKCGANCSHNFLEPAAVFVDQKGNIELTPQFNQLLSSCDVVDKEAPYGSVSDLEIPTKRLSKVPIKLEEWGILQKIRNRLVPLCGVGIVATLDALVIRGKFAGSNSRVLGTANQSEHSIGTLLLCLPSNFAGGCLDVWHGLKAKSLFRINWSECMSSIGKIDMDQLNGRRIGSDVWRVMALQHLLTSIPQSKAYWAAWLHGCSYELQPVTAGFQVLLRYNICRQQVPLFLFRTPKASSAAIRVENSLNRRGSFMASADESPYEAGMWVPSLSDEIKPNYRVYPDHVAISKGSSIYLSLLMALGDPLFMPQGGLVGLPCLHLYEKACELPGMNCEASRDICSGDVHLKGADSFVYVSAARLGLRPKVLTLLEAFGKRFLRDAWPSSADVQSWTTAEHQQGWMKGLSAKTIARNCVRSVSLGDYEVTAANLEQLVKWLLPLTFEESLGEEEQCGNSATVYSSVKPEIVSRGTPLFDCTLSGLAGAVGERPEQRGGGGADAGILRVRGAIVFQIPPTALRTSYDWREQVGRNAGNASYGISQVCNTGGYYHEGDNLDCEPSNHGKSSDQDNQDDDDIDFTFFRNTRCAEVSTDIEQRNALEKMERLMVELMSRTVYDF